MYKKLCKTWPKKAPNPGSVNPRRPWAPPAPSRDPWGLPHRTRAPCICGWEVLTLQMGKSYHGWHCKWWFGLTSTEVARNHSWKWSFHDFIPYTFRITKHWSITKHRNHHGWHYQRKAKNIDKCHDWRVRVASGIDQQGFNKPYGFSWHWRASKLWFSSHLGNSR